MNLECILDNWPSENERKDVISFQASVYIPMIITIICSLFDILSKWQLLDIDILKDEVIVNVVLSYFFPTVFAAALGMLWTRFFGSGISGIKYGFEVRFFLWTVGLFIVYLINLFMIKICWVPYIFLIYILIYVYVSFKKYLNFELLKDIGLEKNKLDIKRASGGDE